MITRIVALLLTLGMSAAAFAESHVATIRKVLDQKAAKTEYGISFKGVPWTIKKSTGPRGGKKFVATKNYVGDDGYEASIYATGHYQTKGGKTRVQVRNFGLAE